MSSATESVRLGEIIKWEQDGQFSRDKVIVESGQDLSIGAVVGKQSISVPTTGTADAGNTGDGTCTLVVGKAETLIETLTLLCTTAATNAGTFSVTGSKTGSLPPATVGTAYVSDVANFTINDGDTDFIVGDTFVIDVEKGDNKVVEMDPAAVDGSNHAAGILIAACDASTADTESVIIGRDAIAMSSLLSWKTGATEGQKATALAELKALGIVTRAEA